MFFRLVRRATWRRFLGAAALFGVYAAWVAAGDSPLTRARGAAGRLPELTPGFDAREPAATLARLGEARVDYLWLQAFDLPFVALVAMIALLALALAAQRNAAAYQKIRTLLFIPVAYGAAELIENTLLALFASGVLAPAAPLAIAQQAATTIKLGLAALTALVALSFIAAIGKARPRGRAAA